MKQIVRRQNLENCLHVMKEGTSQGSLRKG